MNRLILPSELEVTTFSSFSELDVNKLRDSIDSSFAESDKQLVSNYFENTTLLKAHVGTDYGFGAITTDLEGTVYVCKFFVTPEFQQNGHAGDLLMFLFEYYDGPMALRCEPDNLPARMLYSWGFTCKQGGNSHTSASDLGKEFVIYERGIDDRRIEQILSLIYNLPETMVPKGTQTLISAPELPQ